MDKTFIASEGFKLTREELAKLSENLLAFILANIAVLEKMSVKELKKLLVSIQDEHKAEQEIIMIIKKLISAKKGTFITHK